MRKVGKLKKVPPNTPLTKTLHANIITNPLTGVALDEKKALIAI